jgi:intracellular sulfur oxidation DsrE/DsrF family protein
MAYRALFHVNEASEDKHRAVVRTIFNLLAEVPDAEVELVVQGDALPMVMQGATRVREGIEELKARKVRVAVCQNTMNAKGVTREDLLPGLEVVPSAIGEIVRRQHEGMAYVKP